VWAYGLGMLLLGGLAVLALASPAPAGPAIPRVSVTQTIQLRQGRNPPLLVDTRPGAQYAAGHIAGARSGPAATLDQWAPALPGDRLIILYCQ
ncbi:MAG: rhodanese-like domain-containing protein, partial [Candidatus Dormibacteraeota bacterium]|nr:rhodanese-like domain-containing protein [Candidatus Dormibacteraeota bacterium]